MKKIILFLLAAVVSGTSAQEAPATPAPPAAVLKAFKAKEKKAGEVSWAEESGIWKASFSFVVKGEPVGGKSMTFNAKGKWMETTSFVSGPGLMVLPKPVRTACYKKYAAENKMPEADVIGPMLQVSIVENAKGITYVLSVRHDDGTTKDFRFNKAGKEIK